MKTRALRVLVLAAVALVPLLSGCASDPYKQRHDARQPAAASDGSSPFWWPLYDSWWPF